jgi:hypothetical protein
MTPATWLAMAQDDLRAAQLLAEHGLPQISCFHSEQAMEKALQALRVHQEEAPPSEPAARSAVPDNSPAASPAVPPALPEDPADDDWLAALSRMGNDPVEKAAEQAMRMARRLVRQITERIYGTPVPQR